VPHQRRGERCRRRSAAWRHSWASALTGRDDLDSGACQVERVRPGVDFGSESGARREDHGDENTVQLCIRASRLPECLGLSRALGALLVGNSPCWPQRPGLALALLTRRLLSAAFSRCSVLDLSIAMALVLHGVFEKYTFRFGAISICQIRLSHHNSHSSAARSPCSTRIPWPPTWPSRSDRHSSLISRARTARGADVVAFGNAAWRDVQYMQ
jgi:hypothetical protein